MPFIKVWPFLYETAFIPPTRGQGGSSSKCCDITGKSHPYWCLSGSHHFGPTNKLHHFFKWYAEIKLVWYCFSWCHIHFHFQSNNNNNNNETLYQETWNLKVPSLRNSQQFSFSCLKLPSNGSCPGSQFKEHHSRASGP